MTPSSPSLRVVFLRPEGPRSATEPRRLQGAGLSLQRVSEEGELHLTEWRMSEPGFDATVVLGQDLAAEDNACAYFSGPDRIAMAVRLAPVLAYMPIELMHFAARSSSVREERLAALTAVGQFYLAEEGGSYWDTDAEETVRSTLSDPDVDVRLHALFAEVKGAPTTAAAHIAQELSRDGEPRVRERLEVLRQVAEKRSAEVAPPPSPLPRGSLNVEEDRLALPVHVVEEMDSVVHRFSDVASLVSRHSVAVDDKTTTEIVEMRATELDARILYLADVDSRIGCAYFSGPDRVVVATGSAHVLKYFPIDLAKHVVAHERRPELRILGLRALAWSASHRVLRGGAVDPEIRAIITEALADPDATVRLAATSAAVLLREELALSDDAKGSSPARTKRPGSKGKPARRG